MKVAFATELERTVLFEFDPADNQCAEPDKSYEAVIYLLENQHHVEDDLEESARGLEKRTEQGAWDLYEIQRDGRNAVLGEQELLQAEGVKDAHVSALRIASAYSALTAQTANAAHEMALKDQAAAEKYTAEDLVEARSSHNDRTNFGQNTSPLKSPARRRIVPWDRKVSMPLMDTKDVVEIKERIDCQPVAKETAEEAMSKAIDSRKNGSLESELSPKKRKTKRKDKKQTLDKSAKLQQKDQVLQKSSSRRKSKDSHKERESKPNQSSSSTKRAKATEESDKLKEEIRELEKKLARREAAKAKELAACMSMGFQDKKNDSREGKPNKKKPKKSPSVRKLKEGTSSPTKRRLSYQETTSTKLSSILGPEKDNLGQSASDLSTSIMTSSELSSSSFDVDGSFSSLGGFIEAEIEQEVTSSMATKPSLLSRFRLSPRKITRKGKYGAVESSGECVESSCHF